MGDETGHSCEIRQLRVFNIEHYLPNIIYKQVTFNSMEAISMQSTGSLIKSSDSRRLRYLSSINIFIIIILGNY